MLFDFKVFFSYTPDSKDRGPVTWSEAWKDFTVHQVDPAGASKKNICVVAVKIGSKTKI